jgi:hypothetical protein
VPLGLDDWTRLFCRLVIKELAFEECTTFWPKTNYSRNPFEAADSIKEYWPKTQKLIKERFCIYKLFISIQVPPLISHDCLRISFLSSEGSVRDKISVITLMYRYG